MSSALTQPSADASTPMLEVEGIYKIYGSGNTQVNALDNVSLRIYPGEFIAVIGPSGSGKSTFMNMLGCLDSPTAGAYKFWGTEIAKLDSDQLAMIRRNYIGFVFQSFNLLGRTKAIENVELPLVYKGVPRAKRLELSMIALDAVGLADRATHTPAELSGGQQQRVAIARALVTEPALILADEPTGNLDTKTTVEIMELLRRLNREEHRTIVMVTHEPEVAAFTDRILSFRDGMLVGDGPPDEILS